MDPEETALRLISSHQHVCLFQDSTFDIYAEVSEYIPWINLTILVNGGMDSCGYTLEGEPTFGNFNCSKKYFNFLNRVAFYWDSHFQRVQCDSDGRI